MWAKADKEKERYYLLPGMGGAASRRKHKLALTWAIIAGLLVAAGVATLLLLFNNGSHLN